uniref:Uncharacterized protein n=1 Tax=Physcomitrium patens TaxID=3218 RepID=A0A7I4ESP6_PHYPA
RRCSVEEIEIRSRYKVRFGIVVCELTSLKRCYCSEDNLSEKQVVAEEDQHRRDNASSASNVPIFYIYTQGDNLKMKLIFRK